MSMGFGVGERGISARAESDADFGVELVIRVLEFVVPIFPGILIAIFYFRLQPDSGAKGQFSRTVTAFCSKASQ
jgi:hypothetical protein